MNEFTQIGENRLGKYSIKHEILEKGNEYIIKAEMIVSKESEFINICKDNNTSPITQILTKIEKEHNQRVLEEKTDSKLYFD